MEQPNNFNAPEPVTRAATLYVFRVMVNEPIPMNAGCLKPIDIVIPERSMLKPAYPAAVVAGNVETSQIVTNCLFAAMKALGPSQGTMNNLTFGNAKYQYYETICSGSPAGPGFDGTAGVHVHMTNTRLTDPEILELRYPVLLEEFSHPPRLGRQGQVERRRRHAAAHPLPGADGLRHPVELPQGAPLRPGGRRARRVRRELGAPQRRPPWSAWKAATRPCWSPARRSSSRPRRAAASAQPEAALTSSRFVGELSVSAAFGGLLSSLLIHIGEKSWPKRQRSFPPAPRSRCS